MLPSINLRRSEDSVFSELLFPMGQPASGARNGKDRGKQISRDAQFAVHQARVEVYVGINALRAHLLTHHVF